MILNFKSMKVVRSKELKLSVVYYDTQFMNAKPLCLNVMIIENLLMRLTYYQPSILQFKIQIILRRGEGAFKVSTTFLKCKPVQTVIIVNRQLCTTLQTTIWLHIHPLVVESYWFVFVLMQAPNNIHSSTYSCWCGSTCESFTNLDQVKGAFT